MSQGASIPVAFFMPRAAEPQLWLLLRGSPGPTFFAEEVYRWPLPGSPVSNGLPLFRDRPRAEAFASEVAGRGTEVRVAAAPEAGSLTDLLVRLQEFGVTHVSFDPQGTALNLVTIDRAIIGVYLFD